MVRVIDEGHRYAVKNFEKCPEPEGVQVIKFVKMDEAGHYHDGTTNETILEMLLDRMNYLNGKFPCRENSIAITHIETALLFLNLRTAKRVAQGVEGKHEAHK